MLIRIDCTFSWTFADFRISVVDERYECFNCVFDNLQIEISLVDALYVTSSCGLVGLVATKSHACYLLGGTGWDWVRIPLGLNFSGSGGGVSGHA